MVKNIVIPMDIPIRKLLEIFETACLFGGLSEDTILWYQKTFGYLSSFHSLENPIQTMNGELIKSYILYCLEGATEDINRESFLKKIKENKFRVWNITKERKV